MKKAIIKRSQYQPQTRKTYLYYKIHLYDSIYCINISVSRIYKVKVKVLVTQSCLTLCTLWTPLSVEFSRPEYWSGQPFPSPGDLPNPGIKLRSPTLQVDSLPSEPPGKSRIYKELTKTLRKRQHNRKIDGERGNRIGQQII